MESFSPQFHVLYDIEKKRTNLPRRAPIPNLAGTSIWYSRPCVISCLDSSSLPARTATTVRTIYTTDNPRTPPNQSPTNIPKCGLVGVAAELGHPLAIAHARAGARRGDWTAPQFWPADRADDQEIEIPIGRQGPEICGPNIPKCGELAPQLFQNIPKCGHGITFLIFSCFENFS